MLYHLIEYLKSAGFDFPGAGLMHYISFRAICCSILAIFTSLWVGKKIIARLQKKQIGETIRDLGLEGQLQKKGTPTMGGIIILISILVPILLFGNLTNTNVLLLILTTVWLGALGFLDDYIKVFKHNKEGLNGRYKIVGQVLLGVIVGLTLYFTSEQGVSYSRTTIPFFKGNEFDYKWLIPFSGPVVRALQGGLYVVVITFIITACSNGTNLTDGMDGLAAGVSAIVGATLGVLAYLSGHAGFADYLNIMYLPNIGEVTVYVCCFVGALLGFLWYNSFPAQVFMGDTGSLALGGIIGVLAIIIRKELLLPILCGVFLAESLSVIIQRYYFKYTKKKTGTGVRVFRMSPLHHHYQKENPDAIIGVLAIIIRKELLLPILCGVFLAESLSVIIQRYYFKYTKKKTGTGVRVFRMSPLHHHYQKENPDAIIQKPHQIHPENKIVVRFWIVSIILAVITIVTLKIR